MLSSTAAASGESECGMVGRMTIGLFGGSEVKDVAMRSAERDALTRASPSQYTLLRLAQL